MEQILTWVGNLPWGVIIATGLTFIVGFFLKQAAYVKAVDTLGDVADLVSDFVKAQADGKVTSEEAADLINDIKHIVSDYVGKK